MLEQNGIPVIALRSKTYDDVKRNLAVFGTIYGKKEAAEARAAEMDEAIETIVAKAPQDHKKVAIIHATPSSVTVQLETSIAGCAAKMLHLDNVADDAQTSGTMEKVPYRQWNALQKTRYIIILHLYGDRGKNRRADSSGRHGESAWATLRAVRKERYTFCLSGISS